VNYLLLLYALASFSLILLILAIRDKAIYIARFKLHIGKVMNLEITTAEKEKPRQQDRGYNE